MEELSHGCALQTDRRVCSCYIHHLEEREPIQPLQGADLGFVPRRTRATGPNRRLRSKWNRF